ncbi:MAG TPA: FliA/WhiG family RNA polymerase sigma factor [Gemmatimonadaceae bacterium]|nr:FliA/WhiG family RNA polymerase sigma factor [Gemmatimonadaceae bacterium]
MLVQTRRPQSTRNSARTRATSRATPRAGQADQRQQLVAGHVGLVHHVARQLASRLSTEADLGELVSAGSIGLMQAADAFDPSRGLSFSTFAVPRIRGAMLDELRRLDHMPRNVRRRSRDVSRARDVLAASLHRAPTAAEVAAHIGVPADQLQRWEFDAHSSVVVSFHQPARAEIDATLGDIIADDRSESVDAVLTREREVEELKRAIATLKEQERTVLALNFFEELKLQEIAEVLGLSVCRISQIRTAALAKLRIALSELRAA